MFANRMQSFAHQTDNSYPFIWHLAFANQMWSFTHQTVCLLNQTWSFTHIKQHVCMLTQCGHSLTNCVYG